jgi:hypothetical protein
MLVKSPQNNSLSEILVGSVISKSVIYTNTEYDPQAEFFIVRHCIALGNSSEGPGYIYQLHRQQGPPVPLQGGRPADRLSVWE